MDQKPLEPKRERLGCFGDPTSKNGACYVYFLYLTWGHYEEIQAITLAVFLDPAKAEKAAKSLCRYLLRMQLLYQRVDGGGVPYPDMDDTAVVQKLCDFFAIVFSIDIQNARTLLEEYHPAIELVLDGALRMDQITGRSWDLGIERKFLFL